MSRNWTENQKLAIEARDGSLLVSAAAGSGKTAVLVERVIRMITDPHSPVSIDRILIVTYTRAAAAELKERISSTLLKLIEENPDNQWYRRQLIYLSRANISTVDSFCSELVREFFQNLQINGDYRIADSGELSVLKQEAMELTLESMYDKEDTNFYSLVEAFSSPKDDSRLTKNILRLYEFLRSHPFAEKWLSQKLSYYENFTDVSKSVWGKVILDYAKDAVDYAAELTEASLAKMECEPKLYSMLCDLFSADLKYFTTLRELLITSGWDEISAFTKTFVTGRLTARGYTEHPIKVSVAENRKIVRDTVKIIQSLFEQSEEECANDIKAQLPVVSSMFECVSVFDEFYSALKQKKNVADFSDVEHWALNLLVSLDSNGEVVPTDIAKLVSQRFDAVMVDEYQDTNEVQDLIFNSVSSQGGNLFVVGDVKQSIYGFRQAMPEIFLGRKNTLPLYNKEENSYPAKVILERNFRSRKDVTDYINFTFRALMSVQTGDLEYNHEEHLIPENAYPKAQSKCTSLHLLELESFDEDLDAAVAEARYIASLVHKMCSETYITDKGEERLVNFGDISIIMRNMSSYGDVYCSELKRMGVPAVCETTSEFLTSYEIKVALNFLRVIDNPVQDIPLLCVLMSSVYGFTPDDMAYIRAQSRKTPLYVAITKAAQQGNTKCEVFLRSIDELRKVSLTMPADLFINYLYETTGLPGVLSVTEGEVAVSNLRLLCEYAAAFEKGNSKGISAFVNYLDRLEQGGTDLPAATTGGGDAYNAVRIMTVHSSKGLEFPVCILANTARRFLSDSSENALLHSKLGFASKRRDNTTMCSYNTMPRKATALEIKRSEMSEELRVLYVAMTRAKEHLVMLCTKKNIRGYASKFSNTFSAGGKISPYVVRSASGISDWLMMCAMLHPAADNLRSFAGAQAPTAFDCEDTGNFEVVFPQGECTDVKDRGEVKSTTVYEDVPANIGDILKERFDFEYPKSELCNLPQKVTASELAHRESKEKFDRILARPMFATGKKLTGAQRGTAMHLFLEKCDYNNAASDISTEVERLVSLGILSSIQAQSLDIEKLSAFVNSDLIKEVCCAESYSRELRFSVNIPAFMADDTLSDDVKNELVVLEGSIDLAFETQDGIIIVDYKTDKVSSLTQLRDMYSKQLRLYKYALEQTTGKPVTKCLIYSVHLSETTEVL